MKLASFWNGTAIDWGIIKNDNILDINLYSNRYNVPLPKSIQDYFAQQSLFSRTIKNILHNSVSSDWIPLSSITFAPIISKPSKIICVGLNYKTHTAEFEMELPREPVLFSKFPNALAAHLQEIPVSPYANKLDYEAELVMIIGSPCKNVSVEEADAYIGGYTIGNDISERDYQFRSSQWMIGKTWDLFAPVGPCCITADSLSVENLTICCRVNGELRQQASTKDMIFSCSEIISYISRVITLEPGDLIFTGTPGGVIHGYPEEKQIWLKSGDNVQIEIEHIGLLENTFR